MPQRRGRVKEGQKLEGQSHMSRKAWGPSQTGGGQEGPSPQPSAPPHLLDFRLVELWQETFVCRRPSSRRSFVRAATGNKSAALWLWACPSASLSLSLLVWRTGPLSCPPLGLWRRHSLVEPVKCPSQPVSGRWQLTRRGLGEAPWGGATSLGTVSSGGRT